MKQEKRSGTEELMRLAQGFRAVNIVPPISEIPRIPSEIRARDPQPKPKIEKHVVHDLFEQYPWGIYSVLFNLLRTGELMPSDPQK